MINLQAYRNLDPEIRAMLRAIHKTMYITEMRDIAIYGADSGYYPFITYADLEQFYDQHKDALWIIWQDYKDMTGVNFLLSEIHNIHDHDTFCTYFVWNAVEICLQSIFEGCE